MYRFILVFLGVFLAGCTSLNKTTQEWETKENSCLLSWSLAYCILELVNVNDGVKEADLNELKKLIGNDLKEKESRSFITGKNIENALNFSVWQYSNFLSKGLSGSMFFLGFLSNGKKIGEKMQFFAILPESQVVDGDPRQTLENEIVKAYSKYLQAEGVLFEEERTSLLGIKWVQREYHFESKKCGEVKCIVKSPVFSKGGYLRPQVIEKSPTWISGERVYIYSSGYNSFIDPVLYKGKDFFGEGYDIEHVMEFFPSWIYLYMPGKFPRILNSEGMIFAAK